MAKDAREETLRVKATKRVRISVAQGGGDDLDTDLVFLGGRDLNLNDLERLLRLNFPMTV